MSSSWRENSHHQYNNNSNNFGRTASNISGATSFRQKSPSMGRQTAKHHAETVNWMRKTLIPVDAPSRVPEVFLGAEKMHSSSGTAMNRSGRTVSPRLSSSGTMHHHHHHSSRSPISSRRDNRQVVVPSLVSEAIDHRRNGSRSRSPHSKTQSSWTTTRYEREATTTGISPHRHAHSHCIPLRATQLTKTIQNTSFDRTNSSNNRSLIMKTSMSSTRSNAPRWGDPLQQAASRAHSSSRALSISAADAAVDLTSRNSVSAVRALQRSAGSSLPVCNTVGVDNSNCTCINGAAAGDTSSGELMVHAIDTLLRANREDAGGMSPSRQQFVRSNSSPVANRVENIVKKEVQKRIQMERDRFDEEQRVAEEKRKAKEEEQELRHKFEVSKAQREADSAKQALINEKSARARAEAEEMAAKEKLARTSAEDEAQKLRDELSRIDSKVVSPGRIRAQEGMSRDGGNAEQIGQILKNQHQQVGNNNNNSTSSVTDANVSGTGGKFIGGGGGSSLQQQQQNAAAKKQNENDSDEDDSFAAFSSVRKDAETKNSVGSGHYDPVSSKALQRQNALQKNVDGERRDEKNTNSNVLLPATPSRLQSKNDNVNSPMSQGTMNSVVSQLASAGSSPFRTHQNHHDDDDTYEDENGNIIHLREPIVGQSVVRGSRSNNNNNNNNNNNTSSNSNIVESTNTPTKIVRAPQLINGELVYPQGYYPQKTTTTAENDDSAALPPRVGMKERDSHIMDLMRKTQERHHNVLASQKARMDARLNNSYSSSSNNKNNQSSSSQQYYQNDDDNNYYSNNNSGSNQLSTPNNNNRSRPEATLLDNSISPIPAVGGSSPGMVNEDRRLVISSNNNNNNNNNPQHSMMSSPSRSPGRYSNDDHREASASVSSQNNKNNSNARTGPHYSPETLIERPMVAGPSGLWVNRVK